MVLADSCRGFNLAIPSSSVSYHDCIPNPACQEGRKSWLSLIGFRKFIRACPCIIALMVRSRPQAPDTNRPILTKRCKYRPDFTRFVSKMIIGVKKASFLHRITVTCKENISNTTTRRKFLQDNLSRMRCADYNPLYQHLYQVLRRRDKALRISWKPMSWGRLHQRKYHRP